MHTSGPLRLKQVAKELAAQSTSSLAPKAAAALTLGRYSACAPRALFVGASTGGPQALAKFLGGLAPEIGALPIFVVLHVPADFTSIVTTNIARITGLEVRIGAHGEQVKPGKVYFAPGDMHMRVLRMGETPVIVHSNAAPENFCKPAVDVLFRSAAQSFGPSALGIILTGMGADGLAGSHAIVEAGGAIIAQDEATSVVWGMPGAVARSKLAAAVLPIDEIAGTVIGLTRGQRPGRAR